jgi:photosystem II stability/assembly factor-like uncharacterized protein
MLLWGTLAGTMQAANWFPMGPFGGDARSFSADPSNSNHLYLGTATGWLYQSNDGGNSWARVSQVGDSNDLVLDHILIDPANPEHLIVGAFKIDRPDGGIYISEDGGKSWYAQAQMHGQSVRSMARSVSDPKEIVAGTLQGVFRSMDDGAHWSLISPEGSTEIHEIESIAIDPVNPQIIYAGTWHLPWKTSDGGEHWVNIKHGIIDDSDVFSIVIDPKNPNIVYASACSGIYKSEDGGALFRGGVPVNKLQGIPVDARRTRKLTQDPDHLNTLYAGTTEGLYKTIDGGVTFVPMTGPNLVVNDVYVDPKDSDHVLLATDRSGVLSSEDGGVAFHPSNTGFSTQQVSSYAADLNRPATIYVGVVNGKSKGGVFQSLDGGLSWHQRSDGLEGLDVFSLVTTPADTLLAGTAHGIFRLGDGGWVLSNTVMGTGPDRAPHYRRAALSRRGRRETAAEPRGAALDTIIYTMVSDGNETEFAGTGEGLYRTGDDGQTWAAVKGLDLPDTHFVAVHGQMVMAAGLRRIALSMDGGNKWDVVPLPSSLTQISAVAIDGMKNLWVGGTEGAFYSTDYGLTWKTLQNLYLNQVNDIHYDAASHQVLVTSANQKFAFGVQLPSYTVKFWDTGWKLRFVRPVGDHLIGATLFDGMVLQPRMVASQIPKSELDPK